jgi:hypothetical protein
MGLENLSEIEKKTFNYLKEKGSILIKNLNDKRMIGAISTLKNKGLVEIQKKYSSKFQRKKKKFVTIK